MYDIQPWFSKLLSFMVQKTGDPLVAITFIIIIDCIFIPMISVTLVDQNVQNEKGKGLKPLAVQGFADDIALVTYNEKTLRDVISIAKPIKAEANLEVKDSKWAAFYNRRSDNNWYKGINGKKSKVNIQSKH